MIVWSGATFIHRWSHSYCYYYSDYQQQPTTGFPTVVAAGSWEDPSSQCCSQSGNNSSQQISQTSTTWRWISISINNHPCQPAEDWGSPAALTSRLEAGPAAPTVSCLEVSARKKTAIVSCLEVKRTTCNNLKVQLPLCYWLTLW